MAGDWIKMRGGILQHPKLIGLCRSLMLSDEFRDWLTPGGALNGQIVSDDALRCVTCALLLRVWSASREFGKFVGEDLHLAHITLTDLDVMAGAPGFGEAMELVGWAIDGDGVTLPNFKQHNVPMTNAEKQSEHRRRKGVTKPGYERVTKLLPSPGNESAQNVTTREEESREENKENTPLPPKGDDECGIHPFNAQSIAQAIVDYHRKASGTSNSGTITAVAAVRVLLEQERRTEDELKRASENYGKAMAKVKRDPSKRNGAKSFFADGVWLDFKDGVPGQPEEVVVSNEEMIRHAKEMNDDAEKRARDREKD